MTSLLVPDTDKLCRGCSAEIVREVVRCEKCNAPFHPACFKNKYKKCCGSGNSSRSSSPSTSGVAITKDDLSRMLDQQFKNISLEIRPMKETLNDVSTRVSNIEKSIDGALLRMDTVERDVEGIKKDLESINNKLVDCSEKTFSNCLRELEDRNSRKSNLILFNVPEKGNNSSNKESFASDSKICSDILSFLSSDTVPTIRSFNRIGVRTQMSRHPRPLRVTLRDEFTVKTLISAFSHIKQNHVPFPPSIPANLSLSWDKTLLQVQEYRTARASMEEQIKKGEKGLRVVYVRGAPKVMAKSTTPRPAQDHGSQQPTQP